MNMVELGHDSKVAFAPYRLIQCSFPHY
jgi:hypothetical protein